ncbi:MAG: haloacid dehalogenase-like hydrolase [Holosporaceae bacterium]|jgi:phosphoserine phosphatase|nr:haloacid dehalogenase-like hydrolase [Holosporaceae bacterium]
MRNLPICVDLDGTLIKGDVTMEAVKSYWRRDWLLNPFRLLYWLFLGRAQFKQNLAERVELDVSRLHYHEGLLKFLLDRKKKGHKVFLVTASNESFAGKVADHIGIFDGVLASNVRVNLRAKAKAEALVTIFGEKGFIYAGNSNDDLHVWRRSAGCIMMSPTNKMLKKVRGRRCIVFEWNS